VTKRVILKLSVDGGCLMMQAEYEVMLPIWAWQLSKQQELKINKLKRSQNTLPVCKSKCTAPNPAKSGCSLIPHNHHHNYSS